MNGVQNIRELNRLKLRLGVVNGPGESKYANIGISLPGLREDPTAPVYIDGELATTLRGDTITQDFMAILDDYLSNDIRADSYSFLKAHAYFSLLGLLQNTYICV